MLNLSCKLCKHDDVTISRCRFTEDDTNCSEERAARVTRIFFVNLQIKFLFYVAPVLVVDNEATGCVRSANAAAVSLYGQQELIHVKTAIAFHVAFLNPLNSE